MQAKGFIVLGLVAVARAVAWPLNYVAVTLGCCHYNATAHSRPGVLHLVFIGVGNQAGNRSLKDAAATGKSDCSFLRTLGQR
jgi:hypothetical protein